MQPNARIYVDLNSYNFTSELAIQVAIDSATPVDDAGPSFMMNPAGPFRSFGGSMRPFDRMYGGLHFDDVSIYVYICFFFFGNNNLNN